MSAVIRALGRHSRHTPEAAAVRGADTTLGYRALAAAVAALEDHLRGRGYRRLALLLDNGPAWAVADLAAQAAGVLLVPLPGFFSDAQLAHVLRDAGVEALLTDAPLRCRKLGVRRGGSQLQVAGATVHELRLSPGPVAVPEGIAKITYTSGTTGEPKGVCLRQDTLDTVAQSLVHAAGVRAGERHLSVLPLATLLENVGGLYAPLLAGASATLLPLAQVGVHGAAGLDVAALRGALARHGAQAVILMPQMLQGLVEAQEAAPVALPALRYAAVGGAPIARELLTRAHRAGLPVYEGYGLSECGSVVALNTPESNRTGSVGRPLAHVRLVFAPDGEILVQGAAHAGYLGACEAPPALLPTGDLGHLDAEGFLHLTGRKKNLFITAYGRNVAPEWVERELTVQPAIAQAAVFGEGRPWNAAVLVPRRGADSAALERALRAANARLPDYARVSAWVAAREPFSFGNGQLTTTGRPRRAAIKAAYAAELDALYDAPLRARNCE